MGGADEEFDLTESFVWMHAKHLSRYDSDDLEMEDTSTEQTKNQAMKDTDEAAAKFATDGKATTKHEAGRETLQQLKQKEMETLSEQSDLPSCLSLSRSSSGTLINSSTYVDEHIKRVIVSDKTEASNDQADMGTLGPYREALVQSDIQKLRRVCELRGLRHDGQDRSNIIEMLLADFSFLNKHR